MSSGIETPQRVSSPLSSGRASPIPSRSRQRDEDSKSQAHTLFAKTNESLDLLKKDKGYRRYASTVERVLSQFDTSVEEWADYITFLGRLLKALSVKPSGFTEIPHKFLVAKRLSQCLNPVLPSGVHQKTLEVYAYVFSTLGKEGVAADLGLYLPGLSPILSFAALSVKPNVLNVFETYIVPLKASALRPALKSILLALLPGLEEENSEEFERTLRIITALKASIARDAAISGTNGPHSAASEQYFWQCMFLAGITSSTRRPGTLAYMVRDLPSLGNVSIKTKQNGSNDPIALEDRLQDAIDAVASPEPGLLIRCFCAGLQDSRPLIQRGFLDLLVSHLPLSSAVLQERVITADLGKLVIAATSVVARKDMSLNRRLWSWFLGPEPTPEANGTPVSPVDTLSPTHNVAAYQSQHFERFGLLPLVSGITLMFTKDSQDAANYTKALRICQSLMDKWEIGGLVGPRIFLLVMNKVWSIQTSDITQESKNEVLKSANIFFDGVESSLIWSEIYEILSRALSTGDSRSVESQNHLDMVYFVITNFNIREEEMQTVHMPLIILLILVLLQKQSQEALPTNSSSSDGSPTPSLKIALRLIDLIPSRALVPRKAADVDQLANPTASLSRNSILSGLATFYQVNKGNIDIGRPFSDAVVGRSMLDQCLNLIGGMIEASSIGSHVALEHATTLFRSVVKKGFYARPNLDQLLDVILMGVDELQLGKAREIPPFAVTAAKVATIDALFSTSEASKWMTPQTLRNVLPGLIHELWPALSATRPKHNVEAARALWTLYGLCEDKQLIDSTIVTLMIHEKNSTGGTFIDEENARRFTTLWTHSQNLPTQGNKQAALARKSSLIDNMASILAIDTLLERPLMLLLDSLDDSTSSLFPFVVGWLQSMPSMIPIFNLLVSRLSALYPIVLILKRKASVDSAEDDSDGLSLCFYYLQTIYNVIRHGNNSVWEALVADSPTTADGENPVSIQELLIDVALRLLQNRQDFTDIDQTTKFQLAQVCLSILRQFYSGHPAAPVVELSLELPLISELVHSIEYNEHMLQTSLMDIVLASLRSHYAKSDDSESPRHRRAGSKDLTSPISPRLSSGESENKRPPASNLPPRELLDAIMLGLKSANTRPVLESWTTFLSQCLAFYGDGLFQILLPLVGCFCTALTGLLKKVDSAYEQSQAQVNEILDPTMTILLNGLEQTLATAHDVLTTTQTNAPAPKSPEPQQGGFFGSMAGVFASDTTKPKTLTANDRLTVLLCFKDAMKVCYSIWTWGGSDSNKPGLDPSALASHKWLALKLRNRTRRIFEHLFAAEALECLETLIDLWQESLTLGKDSEAETTLSLLSVLESSRPKIAMPAIFNAIYSRTKPGALEANRTSSLTSDLSNITLARFLVTYVRALDDDAMDEIWNDCITFLKDLLADVLPHSQTLPLLIEFTAVLGQKVDNTTFGEQPKVRRELGDLFTRLLRANLAIKPMGSVTDSNDKSAEGINGTPTRETRHLPGSEGLVAVLSTVVPLLSKVLIEPDRISAVSGTISTDVVGPIFRAKTFPENVNKRTLDLVQALLNLPEASKFVKRDVNEAFNDPRFFSTPLSLATKHWLPILQSWSLADKEKMPELLSRLTVPASAGVLGIGANSARLEADKKAQRDLRRIALLILSAAQDTYVVNLPLLHDKIIDLLHATPTTSPSSLTRSEIYILLRSLLLKISPTHLSPFWPTIHTELYEALSSIFPSAEGGEAPNPTVLLQSCKLLDTLLVLEVDEFQMQEWLFISDTTDAVYRPSTQTSVALVDDLAEALDEMVDPRASVGEIPSLGNISGGELRRPLLTRKITAGVPREEVVDRLIRPFFRQLSIAAFESTYDLQSPDWVGCFAEAMGDLFDDSTLV